MTMVSMNTSKMPYRPCRTGLVSLEAAWAMGAEPRPASLEKTPRFTPQVMVCMMVMPLMPPTAAVGLKAPWKMEANTEPMLPMFTSTTARQATM